MATKSEGNVNNVSRGAADDQSLLNSPTLSSPSSFQGSTTSPAPSSGIASSHLRRLNDETRQPKDQDLKSGTTHADRPPQDDGSSGDRFLYFSSDKRRMDYLATMTWTMLLCLSSSTMRREWIAHSVPAPFFWPVILLSSCL
ncbi:hypothetical protein ACHAWF_011225 [Thalassiosira exigua]